MDIATEPTPRPGWTTGGGARRTSWRAPGLRRHLARLASAGLYRMGLIGITAAMCAGLLALQAMAPRTALVPGPWAAILRWAELSWLLPVPVALLLWTGWLVFAEASRAAPEPVPVPARSAGPRSDEPVGLVFRFVTRGENVGALRASLDAVHRTFAHYPAPGPYRIEVATDLPLARIDLGDRTRVFVVPSGYTTPNGSRHKARALAHVQARGEVDPHDWCVYLDEESRIDVTVLAGIYEFVAPAGRRPAGGRDRAPIGQGAILYEGGAWPFRGADALRTADDLGRFRLQYATGRPLFGMHGSFIVVRGREDARLSFDVGALSSLTEDAAWALRAWARGYRFGWVRGYLREQPPQTMRDFVRQRARWVAGIRRVSRDPSIPRRQRLALGAFLLLWEVSFAPLLVALLAVALHVTPFVWVRPAADFALVTFVLAYLQGSLVRALRGSEGARAHRLRPLRRALRRLRLAAGALLLVLPYVWYSAMEAAGILRGLVPQAGFHVIRKPDLVRTPERPDGPRSALVGGGAG